MHWSDGNLRAIDDYLDEHEDDGDCDDRENAELDRGDYLLGLNRDD